MSQISNNMQNKYDAWYKAVAEEIATTFLFHFTECSFWLKKKKKKITSALAIEESEDGIWDLLKQK